MLFDKLCMIAERHHSALVPLLREARLFDFPVKAHEVLPEAFSEDERQFLTDTFFLPFPFVAIEDRGSCVVLMDNVDGQQGWEQDRNFIDIVPCLPDDPTAFDDGMEQGVMTREAMEAYLPPELHDAYAVTFGRIGSPSRHENGLLNWHFTVDLAFAASKQRIVIDPAQMQRDAIAFDRFSHASGRNARAAIGEVMLFNAPARFVVEKRAVKEKAAPKGSVPRSHQRPLYTLLSPPEIRERMQLADPTGKMVRPHERRRHFRTLRSDRYKAMKGKTITVPACWVGPSEATVGKHRYKVMLDI